MDAGWVGTEAVGLRVYEAFATVRMQLDWAREGADFDAAEPAGGSSLL